MSAARFGRLPPAGEWIGPQTLARVAAEREPAKALVRGLEALLGSAPVTLHASGREALRVAFAALAAKSGRDEIVVPAYTCFSVPAAAVAAGLKVRLVDVDADGRIELAALARLPLEKAAAVVVCNLFGACEPLDPIRALAGPAGAAVVDDAAQSLGAAGPDGPAGARGDVGILSFARGKPLAALGGGAIVWQSDAAPMTVLPTPARAGAFARAAAYDVALAGPVFRILAGVPGLGIGRTVYEPGFERGAIGGAALVLAAALVSDVAASGARRAVRAHELAAWLRAHTRLVPVLVPPGTTGVYPRLALRAASGDERTRTLAHLEARGAGASALYPSALDAVDALRPQRVDPGATFPGARDLAAHLLTLPTHGRLRTDQLAAALEETPSSSS